MFLPEASDNVPTFTDAARNNRSKWAVDFLDILLNIPETVRREPPPSNYRPSPWEPVIGPPYATQSRTQCRPDQRTAKEASDNEIDGDSKVRNSRSRSRGSDRSNPPPSKNPERGSERPYCSMECIRGLANRGSLDQKCPNVHEHGTTRHQLDASQFTRQLHDQLVRDRNSGFEILDIRGRTGFLLKASLLSHGYTVIIKATTENRESSLQREIRNYSNLRPLQGYHVPVCVGNFRPSIPYTYHGELMVQMMILSWSGVRIQMIINESNASTFEKEREKLKEVLRSHGVVHRDNEWRNILWNGGSAVMIDLEDISWPASDERFKRLHHDTASGNTTMERLR